MNVTGLRDFRIGSFSGSSSYPAPGIVYVAFDRNGDGQPNDDEWYELAGSEYGRTGNRGRESKPFTTAPIISTRA